METKTNNRNQNTTKTTKTTKTPNTPNTPKTTKTPNTEPSAEDKALAKLVRTKIRGFYNNMEKLCQENGLTFGMGVWVEDPVDRGDTPDKTLKFSGGMCNADALLAHNVLDIALMLDDGINKDAIDSACKMVMAQLKEKMETDNKTTSETKEK